MATHEVAQSVPEAFQALELRERCGGWNLPEIEAQAGGGDDLYFIRIPNGPVKIGRAGSIKRRLSSLQCGCPWRLEVLGSIAGAGNTESVWHSAFCDVRMTGEWFEWNDRIAAMIDLALSGEPYDDQLWREHEVGVQAWVKARADGQEFSPLSFNGLAMRGDAEPCLFGDR